MALRSRSAVQLYGVRPDRRPRLKDQLDAARAPASQIGDRSAVAHAMTHRTTVGDSSEHFLHAVQLVLQFAHLAGPGVRGRRAKQMQAPHVDSAPSTGAADAAALHVLTIRSRAAATGADSKEEASLLVNFTKLLMPLDETVAKARARR